MLYRYTGPLTSMTLADGRDAILIPGGIVDLPDGADVTATLVALGRLHPAAAHEQPATKADKAPKTKPEPKE
ncbi:MAG: hypothetical protein N2690_01750 [Rhodocyclaceae bacterium]|nr:hypothetical protein [Rhodocyclaceae bacterium]